MKKNNLTEILKYLNADDKRRLMFLKEDVDNFVPWLIASITAQYLTYNRDIGYISDSEYFNSVEYFNLRDFL